MKVGLQFTIQKKKIFFIIKLTEFRSNILNQFAKEGRKLVSQEGRKDQFQLDKRLIKRLLKRKMSQGYVGKQRKIEMINKAV